jgi:uncharacterized protein YjbI with pentapeptide repeats
MITSFGLEGRTKTEIRKILIGVAEKYFDSDVLPLAESEYYPQANDIVSYKNLQNHRWISIMLMNKVGNNYKIDSEKFFKFIKSTNNSILGYVITIENLDLSYSHIEDGLGNYNLSGAKIPHSTFGGKFFGTMFVDSDMSQSEIKTGTIFEGCDFSNANMSNLRVVIPADTSPFRFHFINCDFTKSNLANAVLDDTSFTLSKFCGTNLSGAKLHYADISLTNIIDVMIDENTDTKSINLLSKGYYFEWDDVRYNKNFIKVILNDFDPSSLDPKMKEKILHDNPNYQ